jgi:hypothetical protein
VAAPYHQSPITNHQSPVTNHQSPITNYGLTALAKQRQQGNDDDDCADDIDNVGHDSLSSAVFGRKAAIGDG